MLIERALGPATAGDVAPDDYLDLEWWEFGRRALRKTTRAGMAVRVLLPRGNALRDGDLITDAAGTRRIAVRVAPSEVLVIFPRDTTEMGLIALQLGNLHVPTQIIDGVIRAIPDGPVEALLAEADVPYERQFVRFVPKRCVGMPDVRVASDFRVIGD